MNHIEGPIENQDSYYLHEVDIDNDTKIKCFDFSLRCVRPNLITVWILRKITGQWKRIGKANLVVESSRRAKWGDIMIGSDARLSSLGIPNPDYEFRKFRNRGIGSKTVQIMLEYLRHNGIEEVHGEISDRDDFERASNFWRKMGFIVTRYSKPRGAFEARIWRKI